MFNKFKHFNSSKLFTFAILIPLGLTLLFHLSTWYLITSKSALVDKKIYKGDLARNIYKTSSLDPRASREPIPYVTLPKQHLRVNDWSSNKKVDLLTIGDSFSNSDTQGLNPYYQDYIESYQDLRVLNLPRKLNTTDNLFETIIMYINNGLIDEIHPKYLLIEFVERHAIEMFARDFDFNKTTDINTVLNSFKDQKEVVLSEKLTFHIINDKNLKAFKNNLKFHFDVSKYGRFGGTYVKKMKKDFFTTPDSNSLLYYNLDVKNIAKSTDANLKKLNENFNKLAEILKKKGIELYFMPAVDKYDLYSKYIYNNKMPQSIFFEKLRKLPKEYTFIDTKKILHKELDKGIQDIFYADDTHWSYKASNAIFKQIKFNPTKGKE